MTPTPTIPTPHALAKKEQLARPAPVCDVDDDPGADLEVLQEHLDPATDVEDVLALVGPLGPGGPPPLVTVNLSSCEVELQRRVLSTILQTWPGAHLMEPSQSTVAVSFHGGRRPQLKLVFSVKAVCRQRLTTVPAQVWVIDPALLSKGLKP